jgi:hypothetical protein
MRKLKKSKRIKKICGSDLKRNTKTNSSSEKTVKRNTKCCEKFMETE